MLTKHIFNMPVEQSDNTRVVRQPIIEPIQVNPMVERIHPNLEGTGYTNKKWVISDLGQGNVGRDWLGRIRFPDFSIESVPDFKMAI